MSIFPFPPFSVQLGEVQSTPFVYWRVRQTLRCSIHQITSFLFLDNFKYPPWGMDNSALTISMRPPSILNFSGLFIPPFSHYLYSKRFVSFVWNFSVLLLSTYYYYICSRGTHSLHLYGGLTVPVTLQTSSISENFPVSYEKDLKLYSTFWRS